MKRAKFWQLATAESEFGEKERGWKWLVLGIIGKGVGGFYTIIADVEATKGGEIGAGV